MKKTLFRKKVVLVDEELDGVDRDDVGKPDVLQASVDVYSVRNAIGESVSSIRIWNKVN